MGQGYRAVAKSAIPIGDTTLLKRQVLQAVTAGFSEIVVSTQRQYCHQLMSLLREYPKVRVIVNPGHKNGPLPALLFLLDRYDFPVVAVSLADTYFKENPFQTMLKIKAWSDLSLVVARSSTGEELKLGGVVVARNSVAIKISKSPLLNSRSLYRWTGLAIFDSGCKEILRSLLKGNKDLPIENFFEAVITLVSGTKIIKTGDFVNVNTPQDLQLARRHYLSEGYNSDKLEGKT